MIVTFQSLHSVQVFVAVDADCVASGSDAAVVVDLQVSDLLFLV